MKTYTVVALIAFILLAILAVTTVSAKFQRSIGAEIEELRNRFQERQEFREQIRTQLQACLSNNNSTCNATREQARKIAIGFMNKICMNYTDFLDKIKEKIENSKKLTEEEKENLTNILDEKIEEFEELCDKLNETDNATEVKQIFKELKNLTREIREEIRVALGFTRERRVGLIIQRMSHLQEKLERFLANYTGDKSEIEPLMNQFQAKIQEATLRYQEAKELWNQARNQVRNRENASSTIQKANTKMQEAQLKLREAHEILMQIIRKIKGTNEMENNEIEGCSFWSKEKCDKFCSIDDDCKQSACCNCININEECSTTRNGKGVYPNCVKVDCKCIDNECKTGGEK